jgi:hypothetical protein
MASSDMKQKAEKKTKTSELFEWESSTPATHDNCDGTYIALMPNDQKVSDGESSWNRVTSEDN